MIHTGKWAGHNYSQTAMASTRSRILFCILVLHTIFRVASSCEGKTPEAGFSLPENTRETTFSYKTFNNLIVLPVRINDSVKVNLILDTGCRNLLLFGKRFEKMFETVPNRAIRFSGLGERSPLTGKLTLDNTVSIHTALGKRIPIVILRDRNVFTGRSGIDGIIGYDIFIRFEIELNTSSKQITFRPADLAEISADYIKVPLRIDDTRPLIQSKIFFSDSRTNAYDIMLDTGSALGLLIRSTNESFFFENHLQVLGKGLNGEVRGIVMWAEKLILETFEINIANVGISRSGWHTHGSVGMQIIKDYIVVFNYCKGYAGFKNQSIKKRLI